MNILIYNFINFKYVFLKIFFFNFISQDPIDNSVFIHWRVSILLKYSIIKRFDY